MKKISILHVKDNVGTVVLKIPAGETIRYEINGESRELTIVEDIPLGHKVSLTDLDELEKIIKYGEVIGEAGAAIRKGALVHVHNVQSLRGRGDLAKEGQTI
jgi:altronate dehydratase small subunit